MPRPDDSLNEGFASHRWEKLTADDWFAAAIVGAMRTAVNDRIRQPKRDRYPARNRRNDTSGVLAELLLIRQVERWQPGQRLSYQLLDLRKATDLLDVQVEGSEAGLEAKSVLLLEHPPRRDFAINATAADRSARRGAMGYVGVLTAMGSGWALLSRVVPMDEVKGWPVKTYSGYDARRRVNCGKGNGRGRLWGRWPGGVPPDIFPGRDHGRGRRVIRGSA